MSNPLIDDRLVALLLHDIVGVDALCKIPAFSEHDPETFELYIESCRKLAREELLPSYRLMDEAPPVFVEGRVVLHPSMQTIYPKLVELGVVNATRPFEVGGSQLPLSVATLAHAYLMAANLSATGLAWLTSGAAHLVEAFGDEGVRQTFMEPMYDGRWTGTMALTEPQAGSSLADLTTVATPAADGTYRIRGSKIFISGADQDVTENVVNLTLARIVDAPAGIRGVSLFAVPRMRPEDGGLVPNDVHVTGLIHKIGWKGLPSLAISFGERDDCHGWLVGQPHRGLPQMFQMMNEARIQIGINGAATASVAFHESVAYAKERRQGRSATKRDPGSEPIPIIEHADVRRMLLRQKSIVDASLCLAAVTSRFADEAEHGEGASREEAQQVLDFLTPVAKSFPAEWGFESNALAVQVHGGYGYSSEYLPEAWLRDQKLNSIHEGTTGIQGLDLLGRKALGQGGAALRAFVGVVTRDIKVAAEAGVAANLTQPLSAALERVGATTLAIGALAQAGDPGKALAHSHDYLCLVSIVVAGWQHLLLATAAMRRLDDPGLESFARGLLQSAQYWMATELPRVEGLAALCTTGEDSYVQMDPAWF